MPQQKPKKPKPKPGVPPEVTAARKAWAEKQRGKKQGGATAADRAKFAPGRGGLGAMAAANKAARAPGRNLNKKMTTAQAAARRQSQRADFKKQLKKISKNLKKY